MSCNLFYHPINEHILLIDDRRLFGVEMTWGQTLDEEKILKLVNDINKKYKISYENGYIADDVIVAKVEK